ncbi:uncharacterized protein LOC111643615 [Copidosoma floridanum]|uniref:uncharacterized protein LOC106645173 n=1 Tax=Copidosoma floridanum TaxID=29053 RepID=UPI0006C98842|nr:uncharacterized protein LOC106645173 [Copidosoma floridanum]XP_023247512.1 uncharacterized protein LOC111643615 [Copidosoma floridanum]
MDVDIDVLEEVPQPEIHQRQRPVEPVPSDNAMHIDEEHLLQDMLRLQANNFNINDNEDRTHNSEQPPRNDIQPAEDETSPNNKTHRKNQKQRNKRKRAHRRAGNVAGKVMRNRRKR